MIPELSPEWIARGVVAGTAAGSLVYARAQARRRSRAYPLELRITDPLPSPEGVFRIGRYLPDEGEECVWAPWDGGEQHSAIFGTTNAGKTSLARNLIVTAHERWGWETFVGDGKGGVDFTWMRDSGIGVVCTGGAIPTLLKETVREIRRRAELLEGIRVKRTNGRQELVAMTPANLRELKPHERAAHGLRPRLVVLDELAKLLAMEDRKTAPISGPLLQAAAEGRFVGIHLACLMQRGDAHLLSGFIGNLLQARILIGATNEVAERMAHDSSAIDLYEELLPPDERERAKLERAMRPPGRAFVSGLSRRTPGLAHLYNFKAEDRAMGWDEWVRRSLATAPADAGDHAPEPADAGTRLEAGDAAGGAPATADPATTLLGGAGSAAGDRGRRTPSPTPADTGAPGSGPPRHVERRLRLGAWRWVLSPIVPDPPRTPGFRSEVAARDSGVCRACGASGVEWHADHHHPLSRGGADTLANGRTLCAPCHRIKSSAEARVLAVSRRIRSGRIVRRPAAAAWRWFLELEWQRRAALVLFTAGVIAGWGRLALLAGLALLAILLGPRLVAFYLTPKPFRAWTVRSGGGIDRLTYWQRRDREREESLSGVQGDAARVWYGGRSGVITARLVLIGAPACFLAGVIVRELFT